MCYVACPDPDTASGLVFPPLAASTLSGYTTAPVMIPSPVTTEVPPLSRAEQVSLALAGLIGLTLLLLAVWLRPNPHGFGTHQQLGLPPCTIQYWFDFPCPSCGGTTAFAHFVRGEWSSAFRANAASCLFAGLCVVGVPWSWASVWWRRYLGVRDIVLTLVVILITLTVVAASQWIARLLDWVP